MEIYINIDNNKDIAIKTKEELIKLTNKLNLKIIDNVEDADIIFSIGGDGTFLESAKLSKKVKLLELIVEL